ncbi:hypothetical protein LOK49_LG04G03084 [Camellia lanceoleosa]|uniref:Uncharacterized protein n=1 Tax=Camellia lanceoleosa TaxID=1840588 RepID=A0ACC0I6C6_9ERIC|nr:hypothetical protein LOK49_LG04G03084 [Camellia lanceoleosa]
MAAIELNVHAFLQETSGHLLSGCMLRNTQPKPYFSSFVSVIHLLVGVVYCLVSWAVGLPKRAPINKELLTVLTPVAFCHTLGHAMFNVSFAAVAVSFTHTIKGTMVGFITWIPFATAPFRIAEIRAAIPSHCWVKNPWRSISYVIRDVIVVFGLAALANFFDSWVVWPFYWAAQGTMFWALFVLGHYS